MRVPTLLARAQLRSGWRSLLGLALLVTLVGGLTLAGFAAARRTSTAVDRMIVANESADVIINPNDGDESGLDFEAVAALPFVSAASRMQGVIVAPFEPVDTVDAFFEGPFTLATDDSAMVDFHRPVLADGRLLDPDQADEVFLDKTWADAQGFAVGDVLDWRIVTYDDIDEALSSGEDEETVLAALNDPELGSPVALQVVGLGTALDGIAVDEGYEPMSAFITPTLWEQLDRPTAGYWGGIVKLDDPSHVADLRAAVDAMVPDEKIVYQTLAVTREKALTSTRPTATALVIFAVITALLGTLLVAQACSRRFQLDGRDNEVLSAIGSTRSDRFKSGVMRLVATVTAGMLAAVVLAWLLSEMTPVGPARLAEPTPGLSFDATVLIGGAVIGVVMLVLAGLYPVWASADVHTPSAAGGGSRIAAWLDGSGASPQMTTGVRFGLEPGRGSAAVPTRATIIGAITAVAVAVATVVFAASLDRVTDDGRFYGSNFDLVVDIDGPDDLMATMRNHALDDPSTAHVGDLTITEVGIGDERVSALAFSTGERAVVPTIAEGRSPQSIDEVALGATTMRTLGAEIGDTVAMKAAGYEGDVRVVGRVVLPGVGLYQASDRTSVGVGALVHPDAAGPPNGDSSKAFVVVDLNPGADAAAFEERLRESAADQGFVQVQALGRPSEIDNLAQLRELPVVLAALLVLVVAVTVVHAMVIAVRRRRRDVAVLQALGVTTRGALSIGIWQGLTIGLAALLFGVPTGIIAGRWLWSALANGFGTLAEPVVPVLAIATAGGCVLLLAAAAGIVPVRRGLRLRPADVLRSE